MSWLTGYPVMAQCEHGNISQLHCKRMGPYITNIMLMLEGQQKCLNMT